MASLDSRNSDTFNDPFSRVNYTYPIKIHTLYTNKYWKSTNLFLRGLFIWGCKNPFWIWLVWLYSILKSHCKKFDSYASLSPIYQRLHLLIESQTLTLMVFQKLQHQKPLDSNLHHTMALSLLPSLQSLFFDSFFVDNTSSTETTWA